MRTPCSGKIYPLTVRGGRGRCGPTVWRVQGASGSSTLAQRQNAVIQRRGAGHTACTDPSPDTWNSTARAVSTTMQRPGAASVVAMTQDLTEAQHTGAVKQVSGGMPGAKFKPY